MSKNDMTEEQLKAEMGVRITAVNNILSSDVLTRFEVSLSLLKRSDLLGFYNALITFEQIRVLNSITQLELANYMQMSNKTFIKLRDELEELGYIRIIPTGKIKNIYFNGVERF